MRRSLGTLSVLLLITAGCLGAGDDDLAPAAEAEPLVSLEVPVHIVYVGTDPDAVDEAALVAELPTARTPIIESVAGTVGKVVELPVATSFTYTFHEAPRAFSAGFFEAAMASAQEGRPNGYLVEYDRAGPNRLCSACTGVGALDELTGAPDDMLYLDAMATERWVRDNLDLLALDAGPNALIVLLVDGEGAGAFPTDTYHYWRFDDGAEHSEVPREGLAPTVEAPVEAFERGHVAPFHTPKDTLTMRAWGGNANVIWLDLTAAPNAYDTVPRRPLDDARDPPLWELEGRPDEAGRNIGANLADFLQLRVARDAIYPTHAFERYVSPIHVFVEPGAAENPSAVPHPFEVDLEQWVPQDDIERSIERLMPWVEVDAPVTFHFLPEDDPAMMEAIVEAKAYGNPTTVSSGIIKHYIRENWDAYVPAAEPGDFVIPQFYFYFNGPYTFWGVSSAGGWADGDEHAHPWAIIDHFFDVCVRTDVVPCNKGTLGFQNLTILPVHEAGHELGLTHTKDTVDLDDEMWPEWRVNWLWDSQFSTMSYRHVFMQFDWWDQRFAAIAHATDLVHRAEAAGGDAGEARTLLAEGHFADAVEAAWAAYRSAAGEALEPNAVDGGPVEQVIELHLEVPASASVVSGHNLGIASLPAPQLIPEPLTMASTTFEVPEDATHVRIKYADAMPLGPYKSSYALVVGPDGEYRGGLYEGFEDEVVLKSHWRGTGTYELRLYQTAGLAGLWDVEIGIGTPTPG